MKKIFYLSLIIICATWISFPLLTLAQSHDVIIGEINERAALSCTTIKTFEQLVGCAIKVIIQPLVTLVMALALLYFLWGVLTYIKNAGSEDKRTEGRHMMFYGIIALFVMISVWGLVRVVSGTFRLDNETAPTIPNLTEIL